MGNEVTLKLTRPINTAFLKAGSVECLMALFGIKFRKIEQCKEYFCFMLYGCENIPDQLPEFLTRVEG